MARENSHNVNVVVILLLKLLKFLKSTNFSWISRIFHSKHTTCRSGTTTTTQIYVRSHSYFGVYFIVYSSHAIRQNVDIICSNAQFSLIRRHTSWCSSTSTSTGLYFMHFFFARRLIHIYIWLICIWCIFFFPFNFFTIFAVISSSIHRSASSLGWNSNKRPFRYIETCGDFPKYRSRISMWISATLTTGCILTWGLYLQKR